MTTEERKEIVAILQGLLASGHFTTEHDIDCEGPSSLWANNGKDWKEHGCRGWNTSHAVNDAICTWRDLNKAIKEVESETKTP